jgi:hypothetical protein
MGECLSIACHNGRSGALRKGKLPGVVLAISPACLACAPLKLGALLSMFEPDRLRNVTGDECQTPFDFFESFKELGHCNA